jgi:cold shock CspA family protein
MKNEEATCFGTIRKEHNLSTRGFCFIAPDDGGEDVFTHVCDFASRVRGIKWGDPVSYVVTKDGRSGKHRAQHHAIAEGAVYRHREVLFVWSGLWLHRA